jgi:hypothetical protein
LISIAASTSRSRVAIDIVRVELTNCPQQRRVGALAICPTLFTTPTRAVHDKGKLGDSLDVAQGREAARVCGLNCLAALLTIIE